MGEMTDINEITVLYLEIWEHQLLIWLSYIDLLELVNGYL